ncbi:hypothetical protein D3C80_824220 [compost metagenome]
MAEVCRKPQALATKVQAQHRHFALDTLVVPFSVARLFHAIETHAELLAFAKAPANVHRTACLARRGIAAGKLGERLVTGPLGLHIDAAADTASRRDAVDQLAGAFDDVDPVGHFHVDRVGRQDAVQAVVGHIAVEQAEAANGELLEATTRRVGGAHRWVAGDQLAQGSRLLVLHQFAGVTGDAERGFHEVARAEQAL